jgi:predicted nucleic-acid-binding protein
MEVIFVMSKFYQKTRLEISERIIIFLEDADCENNILTNAIKTFGIVNLDFVDCLLFEYSKSQQYEVFTFDEDLKKLINKKVRYN